MFPKQIFKAYDIRGVYPDEINDDLGYKIARAYGGLRQKELARNDLKITVGRDMRLSSPALCEAVIKGLTEQGIEVIDIGLCSTPTFYFAVARDGCDGGLMVSASHNPKEYNGIKIVRERALPLGKGSGMEELMGLVENGGFIDAEKIGSVTVKENTVSDQVDYEMEFCGLKEEVNKIKKFKIVVDTANAMGAQYLEALFQKFPQIELVKMNFDLDGTFPAHQADPFQDENVADLKKRVLTEKADLGIATDGDGDRIFFVDNKGEMIEPAMIRGIMARLFLRIFSGATICYDIRPGKITEDMILENGGVPSVTRVGHSLIKKQMIETGAVFGGESSGHFFVKFPQGVYEAPMVVALKFLEELTATGLTASEYTAPLKKYFHSGEINFRVEDKEKVLANLKIKYADAQLNDLDGLTFTYPDFWFNVRGSNTESLLRLNLEARSAEILTEKLAEIRKIIEE